MLSWKQAHCLYWHKSGSTFSETYFDLPWLRKHMCVLEQFNLRVHILDLKKLGKKKEEKSQPAFIVTFVIFIVIM